MILTVLAIASGSSFLFYGYQTLFGHRPRLDFDRYGIPGLRKFVATMQLAGAIGVLLGLAYHPLGSLAAGGLALMMGLGLAVRFRIGDAPRLMAPAASLAVLNVLLISLFLTR